MSAALVCQIMKKLYVSAVVDSEGLPISNDADTMSTAHELLPMSNGGDPMATMSTTCELPPMLATHAMITSLKKITPCYMVSHFLLVSKIVH